jgi:predicted enzyme related to lactoylglutathione lyase
MAKGEQGRFLWHELMTSDTGGAQQFYKKVVGWDTQKWDNNNPEIDYTMWMAGEAPTGGVMDIPPDAAQAGAPPNWLHYIGTDDVDATVKKATQLGAAVLVPAQTMPGVGRFAVLQDPQGAVFATIDGENPSGEETDPQAKQFSWHELVTSDPDKAWDFYSTLFDWKKTSAMDMGPDLGNYQMFGRDRFTYGGIYRKPADLPAPPHWLHYVMVEDSADEAADRATKAGGKLVMGPMEVPGGDRIAVLQDPQGAYFAVHSKAKVPA